MIDNPFAIPKAILIQRLLPYLETDIGFGDLSSGIITKELITKAKIIAKNHNIIAGAEEAQLLFEYIGIDVKCHFKDGSSIEKGQILMNLEGTARDMLMVERTALNILMKMSSIASSTYDLNQLIKKINQKIQIAATRKYTPGFGWFEKKAVVLGGGDPHRWNLSDMVLLKDTHLKIYQNNIEKLIEDTKTKTSFTKKIEIEIENPNDIYRAIQAGADIIMLDNISPQEIQNIIKKIKQENLAKGVIFEASGNIDPTNLELYASSGVDIISTSQIVLHPHKHSDYSLRIE